MTYRITAQSSEDHSAAPSLEHLFARYNPLVVRTAYLLLGDWMEAEDVAQEVWIQVGRQQDRYDPQRGAWSTWLHKITVNRCLNTRRRLARWITGALAADIPAEQPPPLHSLIQDEEHRRIWRAVETLSRKLRPVVVLRYFHNLSYEQIADVLECPIGTVRSRLHAANAQLRARLGDL
jgi:RNA polymerase sigma-70 factor (ECF subfamily)